MRHTSSTGKLAFVDSQRALIVIIMIGQSMAEISRHKTYRQAILPTYYMHLQILSKIPEKCAFRYYR
jgi:hypothetical protein